MAEAKNDLGHKHWISWAVSVAGVGPFIVGAVMKFIGSAQVVEGLAHFGWPPDSLLLLGLIEISCVVIYLLPRTSVLGAILLTGYIGGAIATHLRLGENVILQVVLGIIIWGGLYLREPRIQALIPLRKERIYPRDSLPPSDRRRSNPSP